MARAYSLDLRERVVAARRVDGGPDVRVRPGMRGRAIDWRDVREDLADFLEDRIDENASLRTDRGQHGGHAQIPRRACETRDVVGHQTGINGMHGKATHGW